MCTRPTRLRRDAFCWLGMISEQMVSARLSNIAPHRLRFLKNMLAGAVGFGAPTLIMLVSFPVLIHALGIDQFGILQLSQAIGNGAGYADLGMANATVFFVARYFGREDHDRIGTVVATSIACLLFAISIIGVATIFFAPALTDLFRVSPSLQADATAAFRIAGVQIMGLPTMLVAGAFFKGVHKFHFASAISVGLAVMNWGGAALAVLVFPIGLVGVSWVLATGSLLLGFVAVVALWSHCRRLNIHNVSPRWATFRAMWHYSAAVFSQGLTVLLNNQIQRMLVGAVLGPTAVALYTTAMQLTTKVQGGLASTFEAFFPVVASSTSPSALRKAYRLIQLASIFAGLVILVPLGVFSDEVCELWLGSALAKQIAPLMQVLCVATLFLISTIPPYLIFNGLRKPWVNTIFMVFTIMMTGLILLFLRSRLTLVIFVDAYAISAVLTAIGMNAYVELVLLPGLHGRKAGGQFRE